MSNVIITGYYGDGVSYAMHLDDTISDADKITGVVETGPRALTAQIEAATGETGYSDPQSGGGASVGIDTIEGVLAYLTRHTEVTSIEGDLPASMTPDRDKTPTRVPVDY